MKKKIKSSPASTTEFPSFSYLPRKMVGKYTQGLYSPRYLANLDCKGLGPDERFLIGGSVCYGIESFGRWLEARTKSL